MTRFLIRSLMIAATLLIGSAVRGEDQPKAADNSTPGTAPPAKSADAPTGKDDAKGRLPAHYTKIVDQAQREKIYTIQGQYDPQIKDLQKQLKALTMKRDAEIQAVLTPDQLKQLTDMIAAAKKGKRSKESAGEKPGSEPAANASKTTAPATPANDASTSTPSAAK